MERDFSRGLDMFNPDNHKDIKIWIIWAWWIGSNSAYCLAKMWLKLKVCDFDEVDTVNTSSQFYGLKDLGKPKVEQLKENIKAMCDEEIEIVNSKYNPDDFKDCQILVLALDSLKVRKEVIETCDDNTFILDTRMVKKTVVVNTLYGFQRDTWIEKERDERADAESGSTRCTEKAICYNALGMAYLVGLLITDYLKILEWWDEDVLPLKYSYVLDGKNRVLHTFSE